MKRYIIFIPAFLIMILPCLADNQNEQLKEKITTTESEYSRSKKQQSREFKRNLWKDKKYVNKWINSDKDYLKLSIEYKKRYLEWAKKQRQQGKDTDIERFIKDEKLDPVEQEIVHAMQAEEKREREQKLSKNEPKKRKSYAGIRKKPRNNIKLNKEENTVEEAQPVSQTGGQGQFDDVQMETEQLVENNSQHKNLLKSLAMVFGGLLLAVAALVFIIRKKTILN